MEGEAGNEAKLNVMLNAFIMPSLQYRSAFQSSNLIGWVGFIRVGLGLI